MFDQGTKWFQIVTYFFMWFARFQIGIKFQILTCELQSIWPKLLVLTWLYSGWFFVMIFFMILLMILLMIFYSSILELDTFQNCFNFKLFKNFPTLQLAQWKMDRNKINCFYSVCTKKCNSHCHFRKIKIIRLYVLRNCCVGVITFFSPNFFLLKHLVLIPSH